jgi:hypothetical protein
LNTARQTGSMVGVALFGSLIARSGHFVSGLHVALVIAAGPGPNRDCAHRWHREGELLDIDPEELAHPER